MKKLIPCLVFVALAFLAGCAEKMPNVPEPLPLKVTAYAVPPTVQIGNPVGLVGIDSNGTGPYERSWVLGGTQIGTSQYELYTADSVGQYLAWYHVLDAVGRRDSACAAFTVVPKDSVPYPVYVVDTLIDSIPYPVTDTLEVIKWVVDTVYQVRVDTLYLPQVCYLECNPWILKWEKRSDTLHLSNPAGRYWVHFDRQALGPEPSGQGYVSRFYDSTGAQLFPEEFFFGYGLKYTFVGVGPYRLPANVTVVIELKDTYYEGGSGKVAVPSCHDFVRGKLWCFVPADSTR